MSTCSLRLRSSDNRLFIDRTRLIVLLLSWDRRNPDGDLRDRRTPTRLGSATFSAGSDEDSYSDGGEVLPMSSPVVGTHAESSGTAPLERSTSRASLTSLAGADWSFKAVDERYLLPLFSNSVASRSFNARKASRRAALGLNPEGAGPSRDDSEVDYDDIADERAGGGGDFTGSVSNFFGVGGRSVSGGSTNAQSRTPEVGPKSSAR